MTPQEQFEIGQRIHTLAKRIESRCDANVKVKPYWAASEFSRIIEDARELAVIGFDLLEKAKEALSNKDSDEDRLL